MGRNQSPKRREFILQPGEGVVLSPDIYQYVEQHRTVLEETGLMSEDVVASPLVRLPIPQGARGSDGEMLRWDGVNPAVLWHPLFWLPESVSLRVRIVDFQGIERSETNEEYLLRVMSQLIGAGLFDIASSTWLDVLDLHHLDIEDLTVQERLIAWTEGTPDPELDAIDLSDLFDEAGVGIESEQVQQLLESAPTYVRAQWVLTADQTGRSITDMRDDNPEPEVKRQACAAFLAHAYLGFAGGELIGDTQTAEQVRQLLVEVQQEDAGDAVVDTALDRLLELSALIYKTHQACLDALTAASDRAEATDEGHETAPVTSA